ncbi:MAG TPA: gluconeogenesis factor YvcK family protein [Acidimicrobiia bacterium]|nr:gluconeogenesis factor YvcK family protein [Acidimicrobiia bacterium]
MTSPILATQLERMVYANKGPKVVALGGGHGLAITLQAVQTYASEITAVVAVADDGGSSGRLTSGLGIPPPGDIRRCLLALTPDVSLWSELFAYRFSGGDIEDHSLGNLLLAALKEITGDFAAGVDAAGRILKTVGRVVPAATEPAELRAVVDGREIVGQAEITRSSGIETIALGPKGLKANPVALAAITDADQLILGPGSLFTSLMAVLLVPGIAEAWQDSMARKFFILNLIDQDGETIGLNGADHVRALASVAGIGGPGVIVGHDGHLDVPVDRVQVGIDPEEALLWGWDVVTAGLALLEADWPEHDPGALGKVLAKKV